MLVRKNNIYFSENNQLIHNILYYKDSRWYKLIRKTSISKECAVPLWERYALSVGEAAQYFGIGENRLRSIVAANPDADYLFTAGVKTLIKRKKFEQYLDEITAI